MTRRWADSPEFRRALGEVLVFFVGPFVALGLFIGAVVAVHLLLGVFT